MTKPLTTGTYDGQIKLCPHNNAPNNISTSFGLITMFLKNTWRGLNQPNGSAVLGTNEADTICRQLGYTGAIPGSAITRRAYESPEITFEHC